MEQNMFHFSPYFPPENKRKAIVTYLKEGRTKYSIKKTSIFFLLSIKELIKKWNQNIYVV